MLILCVYNFQFVKKYNKHLSTKKEIDSEIKETVMNYVKGNICCQRVLPIMCKNTQIPPHTCYTERVIMFYLINYETLIGTVSCCNKL